MFEFSLIPMIVMILFHGSQPERLSASLFLLIYTSMFSMPYLILILFISPMSSFLVSASLVFPSGIFSVLMVLPFLVKMPVLGLHFWLPKAHVEASTSGSMILAGLLLKLGSYGVFRVSILIKSGHSSFVGLWVMSAILASFITLTQSDIKKLIAYSSITHMTFLMASLVSGSKVMFLSVLLLSLAHGWASMGMFFSGGVFSHASHSRLGVLMSSETSFHFVVLSLATLLMVNASVPPLPSFFPEMAIIQVVNSVNLFMVGFFMGFSLVVCYYNVYLFLWFSQIKALTKCSINTSFALLFILSQLISMSFISLGFLFFL